jgi:hypothetical protein
LRKFFEGVVEVVTGAHISMSGAPGGVTGSSNFPSGPLRSSWRKNIAASANDGPAPAMAYWNLDFMVDVLQVFVRYVVY